MSKLPLLILILIACSCLSSGCARLNFVNNDQDGLQYWETTPYQQVTVAGDCSMTSSTIMIPENKKKVQLKTGFGTPKLTVTIDPANGSISTVGQETDTKTPEKLTAISSLIPTVAGIRGIAENKKTMTCNPSITFYKIKDGVIDATDPASILIDAVIK